MAAERISDIYRKISIPGIHAGNQGFICPVNCRVDIAVRIDNTAGRRTRIESRHDLFRQLILVDFISRRLRCY